MFDIYPRDKAESEIERIAFWRRAGAYATLDAKNIRGEEGSR